MCIEMITLAQALPSGTFQLKSLFAFLFSWPYLPPGIGSTEVRTYWSYCWGQSALFGSKVSLGCFPKLRGTQSLWDQRPPRIFCGQTRQDHFPCNQHPGTALGYLNCQGWGRTKTRAKNGQVSHLCPLLIKISTSSSAQ